MPELKKRYCYVCRTNAVAENITLGFRFYVWECSKCGKLHKKRVGK